VIIHNCGAEIIIDEPLVSKNSLMFGLGISGFGILLQS